MAGRSESEAGESLLELLITIAIVGLVVVGLLGALMAMVTGSSVHKSQAIVETNMRRYAEAVKSKPYAATYTLAASGFTPDTGFGADDPVVQSTTCLDPPVNTNCTQQIQLHVFTTSAYGKVDQTLQIMKRSS